MCVLKYIRSSGCRYPRWSTGVRYYSRQRSIHGFRRQTNSVGALFDISGIAKPTIPTIPTHAATTTTTAAATTATTPTFASRSLHRCDRFMPPTACGSDECQAVRHAV